MTQEQQVRNRPVVEEFRANGGVVGGAFEGVALLLLHHRGAKSGAAHLSPVAYLPDGPNWVIVAANGGRPTHPGWYHNLLAHPETVIEVGTSTRRVTARVAAGAEHDALTGRFLRESKFFGGFAQTTTRTIPVFVLEPRD
ncbi:nitroreductase family deazaflavin-dependent oxidoreductase [Actinocrinis puniceicyclus]|uniref:Nitroreductase family deazaflavin-dependent oxidoreductase n=1 Tax=Actinocrinis puniceicyclus TaxID=977794 RepID=A0A8J7WKP6_9ACTN|nr:nitroreductase/quinone reductase family protein [Actinocrinis puniceicyclus]MBS2961502.1 nitroreductase family deazaflavin-dependent oxidoreductase [Actinocrinis puniceicyclus]